MTHTTKTTYPNNNHESRITRLEVTIENINETLVRFEKRFDKIDNRMWQIMIFMFSYLLFLEALYLCLQR